MDYTILKNELINDPLGIGYASLSDIDAAAAINSKNRSTVVEHFVNAKGILAELGAVAGAAFLDALDATAVSNSAVKWAMNFIRSDSGIDVGNIETRNMLDSLAAANILDPVSVSKIKDLAVKNISRAEELGLGVVKPGDIQFARSMA